MNSNTTVFTPAQVKEHNHESSAWLTIEGYVYDVTTFLVEHPGGKEIVLSRLGTDATSVFTDDSLHTHSNTAFSMLARYRIGVVESATIVDRTANKKLAGLVDTEKPILPQIPKLGDQYVPWIHSQCLTKIIIFDNFLEAFTRWPWWYIFIMWTPFIVYMLKQGLQHMSVPYTLLMFAFGLLSWSIVEYTLHRFVFHVTTDTTMWNYFHFFAHGIHHLTPNDSTRLTFPPTFSGVIALVLAQLPSAVIPVATGIQPFLAGLAMGFVLYDTAHYYFHHGEATWMPSFLQKQKSIHLNHHYKDDSTNFGVTSPLFDWVFGTLPQKPLQTGSKSV